MIWTENDRSNDCPDVTTVRTIGELLERPMSMYTEILVFTNRIFSCPEIFTVSPGICPTDAGDRTASSNDEQIIFTRVISCFGLGQHKVRKVQSKMCVEDIKVKSAFQIPKE